MRRALIGITGMALATVLIAGMASAAATPEQKCQGAKNLAAGKYAACRQKAEKGLATTGDAAKYGESIVKCESEFATAWQKAIDVAAKASATCPDAPLAEADYKTQIDGLCDNVATALSGGGLLDCSGDLATCTADLATANGNLATCSGSLGTCNSSLSTCNSNYSSCSGDLTTCNTNLGTCNTNYSGCTGSLVGSNVTGADGSLSMTIPDGFYSGSKTATANDSDLLAANVVSGVNLFGVNGTALPSQPFKTGQTQCYNAAGTVIPCAGTGQDGELQKGAARGYTDNGDGTITDNKTGLMWEKQDDNNVGGIHDKDNTYTWIAAFTKITSLNGASFAGFTDWRLPNADELASLAKRGAVNPAIDAVFNTSCAASCTVTTCSCTASDYYWSSTTYKSIPSSAWTVLFFYGDVDASRDLGKTSNFRVRAVRGGS